MSAEPSSTPTSSSSVGTPGTAGTPGTDAAPPTRARGLTEAAVTGLLGVLVAAAVGLLLAGVLSLLGLTTTPVPTLGTWFAGAGLLGGWQQTVTATVAGGLEWSTWAAGAPLLVTLSVVATVARSARRSVGPPMVDGLVATAGAAVGSIVLVLLSRTTEETVTAAGTVVRSEGLTWLWTGGTRPGTVLGAALLVGATWWVATDGRRWWRQGRGLVLGLLVVPGLVLTLLIGVAVAYLTSSPAVGLATVLLYPLVGVLAIVGAGGTPVTIGITRLSPEPYVLSIWDAGFVFGVLGLAAMLALALVVGAVLGLRRTQVGWLAGIVVPTVSAAFIVWASDTSVVVPVSLGGPTQVSAGVVGAAAVTAVMAAIALLISAPLRLRRDHHGAGTSTDPGEAGS